MSFSRIAPWLLAALSLLAALFVRMAATGNRSAAFAVALAAPALLIAAALAICIPLWRTPPVTIKSDEAIAQARRTARLFAVAFAWGAASMLGAYSPWAGLRWQHGWQYGAGMVLLAALSFSYGLALGGRRLRSARLQRAVMWGTILSGIGAAAAAAWLVSAGKLQSPKGDWAANDVFFGLAIAISGISAVAVYTKFKMVRDL
jgi:hypothetical protein